MTSVAEAKALEGEVDSLQTDAFDIERVIAQSAQEGSGKMLQQMIPGFMLSVHFHT